MQLAKNKTPTLTPMESLSRSISTLNISMEFRFIPLYNTRQNCLSISAKTVEIKLFRSLPLSEIKHYFLLRYASHLNKIARRVLLTSITPDQKSS